MTIDTIELCARLTLHESLLLGMYADAFSGVAPEVREKIKADFISGLRYNMKFQHDDGDTSFQVQAATVQLAEAFFSKAIGRAEQAGK